MLYAGPLVGILAPSGSAPLQLTVIVVLDFTYAHSARCSSLVHGYHARHLNGGVSPANVLSGLCTDAMRTVCDDGPWALSTIIGSGLGLFRHGDQASPE